MKIGATLFSKTVEANSYSELVRNVRREIEREVRQCVDEPTWKPRNDGSGVESSKQVLLTMWAMLDLFEKGLKGLPFDEEGATEIMDALFHTYTFWSTGRLHLLDQLEEILKKEKTFTDSLLARLEKLHQIPDRKRMLLFDKAKAEHEKNTNGSRTKRGYTWGQALEDANKVYAIYSTKEFDAKFDEIESHFRKWRANNNVTP